MGAVLCIRSVLDRVDGWRNSDDSRTKIRRDRKRNSRKERVSVDKGWTKGREEQPKADMQSRQQKREREVRRRKRVSKGILYYV